MSFLQSVNGKQIQGAGRGEGRECNEQRLLSSSEDVITRCIPFSPFKYLADVRKVHLDRMLIFILRDRHGSKLSGVLQFACG